MRGVAIIYSELRVTKTFVQIFKLQGTLIIYLFKNCAWWQQVFTQIHANGLASSIFNSYNIREPYPFIEIYTYK